MPPKILLLGITILSIVIIVGGVAYTLVQRQLAATPSTLGNGEQTPIGDTTPEVQPQYPDTGSGEVIPEGSTTTNTSDVNATDNPFLSGASSPQAQIRDQGMAYLKSNQADTAPLMTNLAWTGGRVDSPAGTELYMFYANNTWAVTVENSIDSASSYTITGNYNSPTRAFSFTETYTNGAFKITNYTPYPVQPPPVQP